MTSTDFHVEAIDRLCFVCGSIIMKNGHHILPVLKEATRQTFKRSINLLENVTSSNIHHTCWTHRCLLFRDVRYSEVSAIQSCPLFRGVHYSEVCAIQSCPLFRGVRYSEVSAIQMCLLFRCPLLRCFHIRFCTNSCLPRKCVRYSEVPAISISAIGSFYCIHL